MSQLIRKELAQLRGQIEDNVSALQSLTQRIGHRELETIVVDIKGRINDPFMFVVVGEVKSGKSSFINALLEADNEICKVGAAPMTDTIQQVVYGDQEKTTELSQYLKKISFPDEILKEIAIVDTPGTNTIIEHHQEITESFIPSSDLIVFVFEAKNPYRESAWNFFDFIKEEWHKKVIFILQQKDLLNEDDLRTNINGLKEQALRKGMADPVIFSVSALRELEGKTDESGFSEVRKYIYENITGGKAPVLKLINVSDTAANINEKIKKGVGLRKHQWESDVAFREDIKGTLDHQEERTQRQVEVLVENLLAGYDRTTGRTKDRLTSGIGFFSLIKRTIQSTFGAAKSPKQWLDSLIEDLENELNKELKDRLQEGIVDIAESIQDMGKVIDAKIKSSKTILKDNHEIFADIAERRAQVLNELQKAFSGFLKKSENFYQSDMMEGGESVSPNLATGSGIAIVGIVLTAVTNTMVVDITGGILTAVGFLFAGIAIGLNRRKIISGYDKEVAIGRDRIETEVSKKLKNYVSTIKEKIDDNFRNFDKMLSSEKEIIEKLDSETVQISAEMQRISAELKALVD